MTVQTKEGNVYKQQLGYAKGSHRNPLTQGEIIAKFNYLTQQALEKKKCMELLDIIMSLEGLNDIGIISRYLNIA